jgi:hypothetical protein
VSAINYGSFESHPARFTRCEAWVLFGNDWRELNASDVYFGVEVMTKKDFETTYGKRPPLPDKAFST